MNLNVSSCFNFDVAIWSQNTLSFDMQVRFSTFSCLSWCPATCLNFSIVAFRASLVSWICVSTFISEYKTLLVPGLGVFISVSNIISSPLLSYPTRIFMCWLIL